MDAMTLRSFVAEHPKGVTIRMIDGTRYDIPHRDYIWFTPAYGKPQERVGRYSTCFWIHDIASDQARLINALMVAEVAPLENGDRGGSAESNGSAT